MNWLDELMDDVAVEVALEQAKLSIASELQAGNFLEIERLAAKANRIQKARSPEMLARIELDWAPKKTVSKG